MQAAGACCALLQGCQADVAGHCSGLLTTEDARPRVSCGLCPLGSPAQHALRVRGLLHCPVPSTAEGCSFPEACMAPACWLPDMWVQQRLRLSARHPASLSTAHALPDRESMLSCMTPLVAGFSRCWGSARTVQRSPCSACRGKRVGVYGAYLLAIWNAEAEEFQTISKIGTGFSEERLKELTEQLNPHQITKPHSYYRCRRRCTGRQSWLALARLALQQAPSTWTSALSRACS